MVDRVVFVPERMPLLNRTDGSTSAVLTRWHTEQWVRLGNYVVTLENKIAELEARIAELEP